MKLSFIWGDDGEWIFNALFGGIWLWGKHTQAHTRCTLFQNLDAVLEDSQYYIIISLAGFTRPGSGDSREQICPGDTLLDGLAAFVKFTPLCCDLTLSLSPHLSEHSWGDMPTLRALRPEGGCVRATFVTLAPWLSADCLPLVNEAGTRSSKVSSQSMLFNLITIYKVDIDQIKKSPLSEHRWAAVNSPACLADHERLSCLSA